MKRLLLLTALLAVTASARPLQIPVIYYRLPNGLKVIISEMHTAPTVTVALYYNVGFRIEPKEIEAALGAHPDLRAALVLARDDAANHKLLVAYIVPKSEALLSTAALRSYLKERLPDYMVPSFFVHLDQIPLTPHGKIDRRALPEPESIFAEETEYQAPRTTTEELLSELWASVLRVSRVGLNDNFFALGGHSLVAIQLVSRIREAFGVELPLRELFESRNVAELAHVIDDLIRANHELVVPPLYG